VDAESNLQSILVAIRKVLGPGYLNLQYKSVLSSHVRAMPSPCLVTAVAQHLIEVNKKDLSRVPADWLKVNEYVRTCVLVTRVVYTDCASSIKACVRYHPPEVLRGMDELQRHRDELGNESVLTSARLHCWFQKSRLTKHGLRFSGRRQRVGIGFC